MNSRHSDGRIYTNDNCVGCNRCVHTCPTLGANISSKASDRIRNVISDKNCVHCGRCISKCGHDARYFKDDTEAFVTDLKSGEEISLLLDPMFYYYFGDNCDNVFGYFKSLGIKGIYDAAVGGTICAYEHARYLKEHLDENGNCDRFLAHVCPGISNYASKYHPKALEHFIPVHTPSVCAAIYFKKYKKVTGKIALITPCIAIADEIESCTGMNSINYVIGLSSLMDLLSDVDLSSYSAEIDYRDESYANSFVEVGKFTDAVRLFFKVGERFNYYDGFDKMTNGFFDSDAFYEKGVHPMMIEVVSCSVGCIIGPAVPKERASKDDRLRFFSNVYNKSVSMEKTVTDSPDERYEVVREHFNYLNDDDFYWESDDKYIQRTKIPETVINEIYETMHKDTDDKRHFDCGACGHKSCRHMAIAVANGYSRIEDCVHYMNDEMKHQLGVDNLTGLMNRSAFIAAGEKLMTENPDKKYALIIADINGLGGINDLYDNAGGDAVIKYVSGYMRDYCIGRGICARLGGGSFGNLVERSKANKEQFIKITQMNIEHLGIEYPLSFKCGIYEIKDNSISMSKAIMYATYAYRCARDKSRNTYIHYTETMTEAMYKESEVTQKMRTAMEKGEFVPYLQPKYDHRTGKPAGAEVLSRWIKEDGSMVSPGIFIPVFEKNGFVGELDRYVWKSSFALIEKWINDGAVVVPISVNISRISLAEDDVLEYIESLDKEYPNAHPYIQFEITESAYVSGEENLTNKISQIRDMGFYINMDDFGSGYSSLNALKDAPIDVLKLDMGFLRGGKNIEKGNLIISAVVKMAQQLGLMLVAEGVETKEQADMLSNLGCNIIQGYYYAKPMPINEFELLMEKTED